MHSGRCAQVSKNRPIALTPNPSPNARALIVGIYIDYVPCIAHVCTCIYIYVYIQCSTANNDDGALQSVTTETHPPRMPREYIQPLYGTADVFETSVSLSLARFSSFTSWRPPKENCCPEIQI